MSKIHITIEDGIEPEVALDHVRSVVKHGRVSKNDTMYCYATLFPDGTAVHTRDYRKSDCFVVYKDKRRNKE
jgi:hypothetical protein